MARCCGNSCGCKITQGPRISVTGVGTSGDPFVISTDTGFVVGDTDFIDLTLTGVGTAAAPWALSASLASTAQLDDLPDVTAPTPSNGHVLGWDSSISRWTNRAPTTAAAGSVQHDTSLSGDGSAGTPLQVNEDAAGGLTTTASGLGLSAATRNQLVRKFADAAARDASTLTPTLNSLVILDSNPGFIYYWTGSQWLPKRDLVGVDGTGNQLLALSGAYADNVPTTMMVRNFSGTTSPEGVLTVLSNAAISTRAGILTASVNVTGAQAYLPVLTPATNRLDIVARRIDTGGVLGSQNISGQVVAYVY